MYQFYWYPKCTTCQKAKKQLDADEVDYEACDLIQNTPTAAQFKQWLTAGNFDRQKFFNSSGLKYRALGLKDKLSNLTDTEAAELLASDGMLVKRPLILKDGNVVQIGFNEKKYKALKAVENESLRSSINEIEKEGLTT